MTDLTILDAKYYNIFCNVVAKPTKPIINNVSNLNLESFMTGDTFELQYNNENNIYTINENIVGNDDSSTQNILTDNITIIDLDGVTNMLIEDDILNSNMID